MVVAVNQLVSASGIAVCTAWSLGTLFGKSYLEPPLLFTV